ncbi:MAG: hypothetical protein IPK64_02580 [bacterium]|nr:hypothetical protein [bacterium]
MPRSRILPALAAALAAACFPAATLVAAPPPLPLWAAFEAAPARDGYDRYLELETGRVYTGGLQVGPTWDDDHARFEDAELGLDVMIAGNGAILDLGGQILRISFCGNRLDVQDCILLGGGIRFVGDNDTARDRTPEGSVRYCTFHRPEDYAVRLQGVGAGVTCERNLVVDPVDTGPDVTIWAGIAGANLPTGLAFGMSVQTGAFGLPIVRENWTWHTDPRTNGDPLHHFGFL